MLIWTQLDTIYRLLMASLPAVNVAILVVSLSTSLCISRSLDPVHDLPRRSLKGIRSGLSIVGSVTKTALKWMSGVNGLPSWSTRPVSTCI